MQMKGVFIMVENKKVMAKNILYYMNKNDVTAADVCKACGFKQNTFSDWVNGKIYPRIDKIEKMAAYFHISKSNLVEERQPEDTDQAKDIRSAYLTNTFKLSDDEVELIEAYRLLDETGKEYTRNFVLANVKKGQDSELSKVVN